MFDILSNISLGQWQPNDNLRSATRCKKYYCLFSIVMYLTAYQSSLCWADCFTASATLNSIWLTFEIQELATLMQMIGNPHFVVHLSVNMQIAQPFVCLDILYNEWYFYCIVIVAFIGLLALGVQFPVKITRYKKKNCWIYSSSSVFLLTLVHIHVLLLWEFLNGIVSQIIFAQKWVSLYLVFIFSAMSFWASGK